MSHFFEIYIELLQSPQSGTSEESVETAYTELGKLAGDLLQVLVNEQHAENYETNFFEVWLQIFSTLSYLLQRNLAPQGLADLFAKQFFKLQPVLLEALYPELHQSI